MMKNYFYWGVNVENLLFKGFSSNSVAGLIGQCLFIGCIAFLFEFLRYLQTKQKQSELILRVKQLKLICSTESAALIAQSITNPQNPLNITLFDRAILFGTEVSLWLLLQNVGYFIMLAVMVFNAWFLVAAVIGGAIGYFIFGQLFMKINLQNCQIMRSAYCSQMCSDLPDPTIQREGESTPASNTPTTSRSNLECHNPLTVNHVEEIKVQAQCH